LVSRSSNPGRHAVLALLSERYPPLRGRSPTCYSPVRHSTQDRSPFRVRLACVRHAASVDSEPGSNSHVKVFVRSSTLPDATAHLAVSGAAPFKPIRGHLQQKAWGSFVCLSIGDGCYPPADTQTGWFLYFRIHPALLARGFRERVHALSSFQRTKAPQIRLTESVGIPALHPLCPALPTAQNVVKSFAFVSVAPSGEPSYFTTPTLPCQPLFGSARRFFPSSTRRVGGEPGCPSREGRGGTPNARCLDRRHRVKRTDNSMGRRGRCQGDPLTKRS
jgi:hypothetical protein